MNNPIEAVAHWRGGRAASAGVFDSNAVPYPRVTATRVADIPTCKSAGLDVGTMLRGIFMPPGVTQEQVDFYIDLFRRCARARSGRSSPGRRVQRHLR